MNNNSDRLIRRSVLSSIIFAVVLVIASIVATRTVVRSLSAVAFEDAADLIAVQNLRIAAEVKGRKARSFLLTGNEQVLVGMNAASDQFSRRLHRLQEAKAADQDVADVLERIDVANREYQGALDHVIAVRRDVATREKTGSVFELEVQPSREELDRVILDLASLEEHRLREATASAKTTVSLSLKALVILAAVGLLAALVMGGLLTRTLAELRRQRQETLQNLAKVEELNRELDAFAGRVAHDLRNVISPIAMAPSLLRVSLGSPEKVVRILDRIQRATDRSIAMLDGLLAFSRSNRPDPLATCSVGAVVDDVIDQLRPLATEVGATIEQAGDARVVCSQELLSVVVMNLVGNALKFLDGSDTRVVTIAARAAEDRCELTVRDTGPGIPDEAIDRVFEPFYRVPGTKAAGSGIGLATVRRIVEAHGGRISAEAAPERGTILRVSLPLARTPTEESVRSAGAQDDARRAMQAPP